MPQQLFPKPGHDHRYCLEQAMDRAREICASKQIRLTALREAVLRALASSHKALGAYEIIEQVSVTGRRLAPISVYRIIDVLIEAGLVHRLESKSAYFACLSGQHDSASLLILLCEKCDRVAEAEAPEAWGAIRSITQDNGFTISGTVFEVQGRCLDCRNLPPKAA